MESSVQEQYIQKKLLYKFDQKLDLVEQEYAKCMFPSEGNQGSAGRDKLIE